MSSPSLVPSPAELEARRLDVLRSFDILDTSPEQEYDDIVELAAEVCGMPIASITLVDETRQWFKARVGFAESETPRGISFCSRVIEREGDDLLIIPDARVDARFRDYPNVTGAPHIRFYAGAPLITHDGWALGTLCVVDRQPRELTPRQQQALRVLRRHVVSALELRRIARAQRDTIATLSAARAELEKARLAAEAGARAKSEFLATMSHEIRTPMNAVVGMTALLRATPLTREQTECVETIRSSGELLLTVINDVLDFSKIESGRLEVERAPFSITECAKCATDLLAAPAEAKGLAMEVKVASDAVRGLRGDATRVRQILVNLLSNAVKFTERGRVSVDISTRTLEDGRVEARFSVRDTGVGIPPERLGRLFQPFVQADLSIARRFGGTGLGLVISRRLAELHGGRLWAESEPGRGSCFTFTVVGEAAELPAGPRADADTFDVSLAARHPAAILVAEDNPVNQKVVRRLLEKMGYEPEVVANGLEALVALRRRPFDLVLMDIEMPEMGGDEATRVLRAELPRDRQPVVVAVTAHALEGMRERFAAQGMDDHLAKPIRVGELRALLERLGELRAARAGRAQA